MSGVSANELFQVVASKESTNEQKLQHIQQLKTHVKKDLVDIAQVAKYVEALSIAVDITDLGISTVSFSVLSHLVKRVSMQDRSGNVLKTQSFLILPIIVNRLGDTKASTRSAARKALEAYWFSSPVRVEEAVGEIALKHRNSTINHEAINWLNHIVININQHFKLDHFLPQLAKLLQVYSTDRNIELVQSIKNLFSDYYNIKHNRLYRFDLARELELNSVPNEIINEIMNDISGLHEMKDPTEKHHVDFTERLNFSTDKHSSTERHYAVSTGKPNTTLDGGAPVLSPKPLLETVQRTTPSKESPGISIPSSQATQADEEEAESHSETDPQLQKIISKSKYAVDPSIPPLDFSDPNKLHHTVGDLLAVFSGRETEFNWGAREKSIIKLRSIIRGNAAVEFTHDLVACFKDASEAINKAISTLRTTLSAHGCQLIKECAIVLQTDFDSLVESFIGSLIKLCSATKLIASTNANQAIISILLSCSYSNRLLQKVLGCTFEKNVQPRSYSGTWIQILILRFHDNLSFHNTGIDVASKVIQKILGDPNPAVRQVAKDSYWCFWTKFPSQAQQLLSKLDSNVVKNLERSRPPNVAHPTTTAKKTVRASIKESIINRNKELKAKQKEAVINSRPSSRSSYADIQHDKVKSRLGVPKRSLSNSSNHSKRSITPTERTHLRKSTELRNSTELKNSSHLSDEHIHQEAHKERRDSDKQKQTDRLKQQLSRVEHENGVQNPIISDGSKANQVDDSDMLFDKQADPILKFLSSNQTGLIVEGINLLKYAILGDEDLSIELNSLLRKISIRDPHLLTPLFVSNGNLFRKICHFFTPEDFLRVCSILLEPIDQTSIDMIISIVDVDQIYDSITKLLSYTISTSNILDDDELTMQIIRYKSSIIKTTVDFLLSGLDRIPISDSYFSKLTSNLFELVSLLKSTEVYSSFSKLMVKLYSINPNLFMSELEMVDESTREEVDYLVGIDRTSTLNRAQLVNNYGTLFDLTQVNHRGNIDKFSPVKLGTDFTMIVPVEKNANEFTYLPKTTLARPDNSEFNGSPRKSSVAPEVPADEDTNVIVSNNSVPSPSPEEMEVDERISIEPKEKITQPFKQEVMEKSQPIDASTSQLEKEVSFSGDQDKLDAAHKEKFPLAQESGLLKTIGGFSDSDDNIFVDSKLGEPKSTLFNQHKLESDHSIELVDDFAQVTLTGELNELNPIEKFIEKVDPLKSISRRNKQISIFEDARGSPQKAQDYSYNELNWFNFQVARLSVDSLAEELEEPMVDNFNFICQRMQSSTVDGRDFISALNYLQNLNTCDLEFHTYFENKGKKLLEDSLWKFFSNSDNLSQPSIISGIILVKQMLINKCILKLENLWDTLVKLNRIPTLIGELVHATDETFNEMINGSYASDELFDCVLRSLGEIDQDSMKRTSVLFVLNSLGKVLDINPNITDTLITRIDNGLFKYMNSDLVEVRRGVIMNYSKLLKATRNSSGFSDGNVMEEIVSRLTLPQQKLIEFYSHE